MQDLIDRLEQATGPDRKIDAMIWARLEPCEEPDCLPDVKARLVARMLAGGDDCECPAYTGSIDALLPLVPARYTARIETASRSSRPYVWLYDESDLTGAIKVEAATPAVALCAAMLKARSAELAKDRT